MTNCGFTGHRKITITPQIKQELENQLVNLISDNIIDFYAGGALGWDMLCEQTILKLKETYPQINLHLILPCPFEEQTIKWNAVDKTMFSEIIKKASDIEIISSCYTSDCMKKRNLRLVELSDLIVCHYNINMYRSGTAQTIRMAQQHQKRIINLYTQNK